MSEKAGTLRQEFLETVSRQFPMLSLSITASLGALGYAYSHKEILVCWAPLLILWLVSVQLTRSFHVILRISTFLRSKNIPDCLEKNWESSIAKFREIEKTKKYPGKQRMTWYSYQVFVLLAGWLCILLSYYLLLKTGKFKAIYHLPAGTIGILWAILSFRTARQVKYAVSGDLEKNFVEIWNEVFDSKKKENDNPVQCGNDEEGSEVPPA